MATRTGTPRADRLIGTADDDFLDGKGGNDRLYGEDSSDRAIGGAGNDSLFGGSGADTLGGSNGNDTMTGGDGADLLWGGGGTDPGRDTLFGGSGDDGLYGDFGRDLLAGGDGNDLLLSHDGDDRLSGDDGNDTLDAGAGNDTAFGGGQADVVFGGSGNDDLSGEGNSDSLAGGSGNDLLSGGFSNDVLDGGSGIDTAAFQGQRAAYSIRLDDGVITVSGSPTSAGVDQLRNVEFLRFSDQTIAASSINPPPDPITDSNAATNIVAENAAAGTVVGLTASSSDPGSSVIYSLVDPSGAFAIDTNTGVVTVADGRLLDFETGPRPTVTVRATNLLGGSRDQDFTVSVSDVEEPISAIVDTDSDQNLVIAGVPGVSVQVTASASDPDGQRVTYELASSIGGRFEIDGSTGVLTTLSGSLIEAGNIYSVTVIAWAGGMESTSQSFLIEAIAGDVATSIVDADGAPNRVVENAAAGSYVGLTLSSPGSTGVSYTLIDDAGGRFTVDADGQVRVAAGAGLNFERASSYEITARADGDSSVTRTFTIGLLDVDERPATPGDANPAANAISLGSVASGARVGITAASTDPDGHDVSYSLVQNPRGRFAIDAVTGVVTIADIDGLTAGSYQLGVVASDGTLTSRTAEFDLLVGGGTAGAEFRINNLTRGDQDTSTEFNTGGNLLAALDNGGFIAVMHSDGTTSGTAAERHSEGIWARQYAADGDAVDDWFRVDTSTRGESIDVEPAMASLTGGGFVVTYSSLEDSPLSYDVRGRIYEADGSGVTSVREFQVTDGRGNQHESAVAGLDNGGFVVSYTGAVGNQDDIFVRRYTADGTASAAVRVHAESGLNQSHGSLATTDGGFVVTWTTEANGGDDLDIMAQRFNTSGGALGSAIRVNDTTGDFQEYSSVSGLGDGGFVVTWSSFGQDGGGFGIYGQRFAANGDRAGDEFRVNTTTAGSQTDSTVLGLSDGGFLVSWTSAVGDGSGNGILAQRFDADGARVEGEFQVNVRTNLGQSDPHLAELAGHDVVAMWTGNDSGDPLVPSEGVYGRIYQNFA